MIYDYLTTIFRLIAGIINKYVLGILALSFIVVLAIWILLSLLNSKELRLSRKLKNITEYMDNHDIDVSEDEVFAQKLNELPPQIIRGVKSAQFYCKGAPGEKLSQYECVETYLFGGLFNQSRSLIRVVTLLYTFVLAFLSVALTFASNQALTGLLLAQSLVLPFVAFVIYKIEYFIYTSIRQYYYKLAVIRFGEFVDSLNDNYESGNIVFGSSMEDDEDMADEKRGRGRPKKSEDEKDYVTIENDEDFERSIIRAEKLVERLNKDLSDSQIRRTNHELRELMASLAEYEKRRKLWKREKLK